MRIIPAIDIIEGSCVRLQQGDYTVQSKYELDPLSQAKIFEQAGFRFLHLVDLDGARSSKPCNLAILELIKRETKLQVDFGGGIKSRAQVKNAFEAGADQITLGSLAVINPGLTKDILKEYGPEKIIIGADLRFGKLAINGWNNQTEVGIMDFLTSFQHVGMKYCICTDIAKDGMLNGPAFELYQKIKAQFPQLNLVASGGVSTLKDIGELLDLGMEAAIVGKALYENKISLQKLLDYDG